MIVVPKRSEDIIRLLTNRWLKRTLMRWGSTSKTTKSWNLLTRSIGAIGIGSSWIRDQKLPTTCFEERSLLVLNESRSRLEPDSFDDNLLSRAFSAWLNWRTGNYSRVTDTFNYSSE